MAKSSLRYVRRFKFPFLLFRKLNINSTYWKDHYPRFGKENWNKSYQGDHVSFQERSSQQWVPLRLLKFYRLIRKNKRNGSGRKNTFSTHDPSKRKLRHANTFSFGDLLNSIFYQSIKLNFISCIKTINLPIDNFFRSCILTVAIDNSGRGEKKRKFLGKCESKSMSIPITLWADRIISIRTCKKTASKRRPGNRTNAQVLKICSELNLERKVTRRIHLKSETSHALLHDKPSCNGSAWRRTEWVYCWLRSLKNVVIILKFNERRCRLTLHCMDCAG